jgi:pyruvate formate lyase activating enzyme
MQDANHSELDCEEPIPDGEEGYMHSHTTGSVVDGPGVRMVVWLTGCHLRCQYCHNPDTWKLKSGTRTSVTALMTEVAKYRRFMSVTHGGLTLSGGEPLVQAPFVARVLRECKQLGIHTALDTNGYLGDRISDADLGMADLVLLDLKSWDPETHRRVTGWDVEPVLRFARRLSDLGRPAWVRFVLVPGLTDDPANVEGLADFLATLRNIERVEVLPFHQMGRYKWEKLGLRYALRETPPPSPHLVAHVAARFRERGLNVSA